ncbi:MAG: LysR family transcriptional regulator [Bacillota bacterium]|nr:LysR family transcriptional regulator [Bacillota bacterium]MDI7249796.1 LysR family transcriptional regulator [Bacillota bacterium]
MNIWQLEVFCTVARVKSFSRAAKLLHLTQPGVSAQVLSLEKHFGVRLFRRHAQGVELTPAGEAAFEYARRILELVEGMEKAISTTDDARQLTIAATQTIGNYALPCTVWAFKEKNPHADVRLEIVPAADVVTGVQNGRFDVGLLEGCEEGLGKDDELVVRPITADELVAVVAPDGRWSATGELGPEELLQMPLLLREPGSGVREAVEQCLARAGIDPAQLRVVAVMGSNEAIKSAVSAGRGVSILSRLAVQRELRTGTLQALPVRGLGPMRFLLIHRRDPFMSGLAQRFIRFLTPADLC